MASDLRVALRISADAGNSRREINQVNQDLRRAGKDGARSLANETQRATGATNALARQGAASYKVIRDGMRQAATQGSVPLRLEVTKTAAELKEMGETARRAARAARTEMRGAETDGVRVLREGTDKAGRSMLNLKNLAGRARAELGRIKGAVGSGIGSMFKGIPGKLAGLGMGYMAYRQLVSSAQLDRQLVRTQQTAGMSKEEIGEWRNTSFELSKKYGVERPQIQSGFDTLIASGLSPDQAEQASDAITQAVAVTGAEANILAKALITASSAFKIDLKNPGAALDLLQKMTVAGRLGNAELENLSSIFPVIGQDAVKAGMSIEEALSFVEVLSTSEMEPSRLATLAKSSLRLFTNKTYSDQVTKATKIPFFEKDGKRRSPADVYSDISTQYSRLDTDKERSIYLGKVLKSMDQETVTGTGSWLSSGAIQQFRNNSHKIEDAGPLFNSNLKDNVESATGTAGRMRATLLHLTDRASQPINATFARVGTAMLDAIQASGDSAFNPDYVNTITGIFTGAGIPGAATLAENLLGGGVEGLFGGANTMRQVITGQVLQDATGVTPVYVVNFPSDAKLPEVNAEAMKGGKGKALLIGAGVVAAGAAIGAGAYYVKNKYFSEDNSDSQVGNYGAWSNELNERLMYNAFNTPGQNDATSGVIARHEQVFGQPFVIKIEADAEWLHVEGERRDGIEVSRGK
ncbi:phage tail tape measure protein [Pseudomonas fragi]|uniref:phage tail tape measure protein n=1 Tax=Pseudomonas fragi TaxID=296 RepID=UPI001472C9EE|nr:phage tail tape measure protein [Pseudomonas fragi]NNB15961.1 phage tail tape measure protein [Pseudomonas fragi]NNB18471.1 phage tail tape measure protein [Pseudomonas fragi]